MNTRSVVLDILMAVMEQGKYSHLIIRNTLKNYQHLEKTKRAFITRLATGTIERAITLDYVLNQFSSVRVDKMKPVIRNILRMSLYQILYMDSVPKPAACNEAVKLVQKRKFTHLKGFVNGILRTIIRKEDQIVYPKKETGVHYYSIKYSMPEWILKQWRKEYDWDTIDTVCQGLSGRRNTSIRLNVSRAGEQEILSLLEQEGVKTEPVSYLEHAYQISNYDYLEGLTAFQKGYFQVQDISSMLCAVAAAPKCGDFVIDVCSAPGGKSLHMADLMQNTGQIQARDLTEKKVALIRENVKRCRFDNIQTEVMDARIRNQEDLEKADIVMADLPCSGLGVLGKKHDLKYKTNPSMQQELVKIQREILTAVTGYVKKGGILIYSTCTINSKENIENVQWLLENFDFVLEDLTPFLKNIPDIPTAFKGYVQILPGIHNADGFFIARFRKK